jgi:GNAT superfamily N-acetyltransferase
MSSTRPPLPEGYTAVPPCHLANVATFLEMTALPEHRSSPIDAHDLTLKPWQDADPGAYRALFKLIGENWLWTSRLMMADEKLIATLHHPDVEVYRLFRNQWVAGLLELDFRNPGQCELAFFGLVPEEIGKGAGRFLMAEAVSRAWAKPIERFWVHTCTLDHPAALTFYRRSGFTPYQTAVEILPDPRLTGHMPRAAAPQIPIIE